MKGEIRQAFATPIGYFQFPQEEAASLNVALSKEILNRSQTYPSLGKSNLGGWRSRNDLLHWQLPEVGQLGEWISQAVREMITSMAGAGGFRGDVRIVGWASVCTKGAYNAPHVHPDSALSGVYYVDPGEPAADAPLSGQLEFLDPRGRAEMAASPGDPFGDPVRVEPKAGLMVIFPSWLYHWVHPFAGDGVRIAVSFNVAVAPSSQFEPSRV